MITKTSEDKLQEHQLRVVNRLADPDSPHGLIALHSLGSGKTYTALAAADRLLKDNQRGLFVVPASLRENVWKEIDKHKLDRLRDKLDVLSYESAARKASDLAKRKYSFSVFDEAHRLRNAGTDRQKELSKIIDSSGKTLMLTGTAGYNKPEDFTTLIRLLDKNSGAPANSKEFEETYVDTKRWKLKNRNKLRKLLQRYTDRYVSPAGSEDFPKVDRKIINVEMSPEQTELYRYLEDDFPAWLRYRVRNNLPISMQEAKGLNSFSAGVRQASDSTTHHDVTGTWRNSAKIQAATTNMLNAMKGRKGFRGLVYSNYVDSGLNPYAEALRAHGVEPLVFTGQLSDKEKKALTEKYNSPDGQNKVMLISGSGAEGLDLKRTRLMQILEPHFNKSRLRQAEGRAIRYRSHADLPPEQRHVNVEEYRATLPKTLWQKLTFQDPDTAIDAYLAQLSDKKQALADEMYGLI